MRAPELDGEVREAVERLGHERQVLGVVAHVQAHEERLRVAREDAIPRLHDLPVAREVLPVEGPVGVVPELVPALVRAVDGEEEGLGVRDVDVDGQAVRRAGLPHRVEAPVVDLDERPLAAVLAEVEAEGLQDLQARRSRLGRLLDGVGLELREARVRERAPHRLRAGVEAAGVRAVEGGDRLPEAVAEAAGQVDDGLHALAVHDGERVRRARVEGDRVLGGRALAAALREGEVRVDVDDREARGRDARLLHVEHGARAEVAQEEGPVAGRASRLGARRASRGDRAQSTHPESGETAPAVQLHGRSPSSVGHRARIACTRRVRATADSKSRSHMFRPNITPVAPHSM